MSGKVNANVRVISQSVWGDGHGECESHDMDQVEGQCQNSSWDKVNVRLRIRVRVRVRFSMHSEKDQGGVMVLAI